MDARLENFDWDEVFKYCGTNSEYSGAVKPPQPTPPGSNIADIPFSREDVAEILHIVNGENDESDWAAVFKLKDGRYAAVEAWCDYTGWG